MNTARVVFAIALITVALAGGCKRSATVTDQNAANQGEAQNQFQHPQGGTTPKGDTKHFKGSIGGTHGLQMKLVRDGETLTGSYFYQKVGTRIDLRGTISQGGNVVLEEFDPGGKQTGVFKGNWKTGEDGLIEISGNWTKPNGEKKALFTVYEEPNEFSNGVEIVARLIQEKNKKLKYEIDAEYPQLTGSLDPNFEKFNQLVRSLVTKKVSDFKTGMQPEAGESDEETTAESNGSDIGIGYTVTIARDDLISILFDVGGYESGAAHPNSYSEVVNFDLKNGRQLKLADLFKPGSKFVQAFSAYCIQNLTKRANDEGTDSMLDEPWVERGAAPDEENFTSWTINKTGLEITFDSYQVAPYAAGPQQVLVPYSALKDMIQPDGPLAQFVK